jgi:hypothetical protein
LAAYKLSIILILLAYLWFISRNSERLPAIAPASPKAPTVGASTSCVHAVVSAKIKKPAIAGFFCLVVFVHHFESADFQIDL